MNPTITTPGNSGRYSSLVKIIFTRFEAILLNPTRHIFVKNNYLFIIIRYRYMLLHIFTFITFLNDCNIACFLSKILLHTYKIFEVLTYNRITSIPCQIMQSISM